MTATKFLVLGTALLGLIAASQLFAEPSEEQRVFEEPGERQIDMKILLDDQVLWRASASDDGHPDADAVWDYLKDARFKHGRDFAANESKVRRDGDRVSVEGNITIDVDYGGQITLLDYDLTLNRVVMDEGERWTISDKFVDKWFDSRLITRREAARLHNPQILR